MKVIDLHLLTACMPRKLPANVIILLFIYLFSNTATPPEEDFQNNILW